MESFEDEDLKISRCNYCQLILPQHLLRIEDVNLMKDPYWICHRGNCGYKNEATKQQCAKCDTLIQEYKYQPRFLFKRQFIFEKYF